MKRHLGFERASLLTALFIVAAGCGSTDEGPATGAPSVAGLEDAGPVASIRDEIAVSEIAILQGVKATIVADGEVVAAPNAPVIANRPAFIRVFVKATARTRPTISGVLRVKRAGKEDMVLRDTGKRVVPELDEELTEQTLNFDIKAEDMTADASFSFKAGADVDGADVVTFPADGSMMSFGAKTASQKLRVKLVPVTYEPVEGVAPITPDLTDLTTFKETLYKLYPVASIEMTVREPLKWTTVIESRGKGWSELLAGIMKTRREDAPDRDVYYVGLFTPKPTIDQFCTAGGCILGLAPLAEERDVGMRAAIILGYKGRGTASTMAHELAHAHGRGHAPCGAPAGVDEDFPYGSGGIGVWGYDIIQKKLINPGNRFRDFMTYCGPEWVSDYTYRSLYERMEVLAKQQAGIDAANGGAAGSTPGARPSEMVQSFTVTGDGAVHEGPAIEQLAGNESGEQVTVSYEGAMGKVFATAKGRVRHLSETGDTIVLAPEAPLGAVRARLTGPSFKGVTALRARTSTQPTR